MIKKALGLGVLDKVYIGILLTVFGGIVLHAPLAVGLGTLFPDYDMWIKSWKELLLGVALVLAIVLLSLKKRWDIVKIPLFWLIGAFAALNLLLIPVYFTGVEATLAGLLINLRYLLLFVLIYVALMLYPQLSRLFIGVFVAGALIVLGFAFLQVTVLPHDILKYLGYGESTIMPFLTVDQNMEYIRINSTLRGPNPLGAYAMVVLSLLLAFWLRGDFRRIRNKKAVGIVLAVGGVVALWASYSRSAVLGAMVAIGLLLFVTIGRKIPKMLWVGLVITALLVGGSLVAFRESDFVSHVILHEDPNEGNNVNSNDGHAESLVDGTTRMLQQPLGGGIGSTGSASLYSDTPLIIENQYLFIAHETGWIGLALFIAIFVVITRELWRLRRDWFALGVFSSGIGLAFIGLIQPVWVDETVALVWWGLAAIALARGRGSGILLTQAKSASKPKKQTL